MFRIQIIERERGLFKTLKDDMRSGSLRTFMMEKRGTKITHTKSPGWITWKRAYGVIVCLVHTRKPGSEWQIISQLIGRLADRYADKVVAINVEFPDPEPPKEERKKRSNLLQSKSDDWR